MVDATPAEIRALPKVMERVQKVREFRERSTAAPTRASARTPWQFFYLNPESSEYILIPEVSSERRSYVPIGIVRPEIVSANTNFLLPTNDRYIFGVLTSAVHMAWLRVVGGRLKSDVRYSGSMVYNTFPWPNAVDPKRHAAVEAAAQSVLNARQPYLPPEGEGTLADLYNPLTMPAKLARAHTDLDFAVDRCYRPEKFRRSGERVEHLFALYERAAVPLLPSTPKRGKGSHKPAAGKNGQPATAVAPDESEDGDDQAAAEFSSRLTSLYLDAFKPRPSAEKRGEIVTDSLDIIYDQLDDLLCENKFTECDDFLVRVAEEPGRSPLAALVGVLTVTLAAAKKLPHRTHLREVVHKRLLAAGQNADAALKGL